jgi:hypothetical protein
MNKPEIIELGNDNLQSSNFGGGLELLMNNDKKEKTKKTNIGFEDLNDLEKDLNDLSFDNKLFNDYDDLNKMDGLNNDNKEQHILKSDLFNSTNNSTKTISFDDNQQSMNDDLESEIKIPSLGKSTARYHEENNDYQQFNEIPYNVPKPPQMNKEELLREKFKFLRMLESLEKKGVQLSKKYNMDSSLAEMQGEYETIIEEKNKSNSIKFQGNMMLAIINGIEFLNNKFDPFDIKLDGLSDQITENINDYDEVFTELYEKYKSKAKLAPELKLMFQLGGSAMMVHMTNTMFKSAMPNMDDILKQNPDLMKSFQQAAVNSMSSSAPGLSNFMDGVLNDTSRKGPPPPLQTQQSNNYSSRGGNNSYGQFSYSNSFKEDGININENNDKNLGFKQQDTFKKSNRNEMKGPSDINELLGKLKTKTINIQEKPITKIPEYNPNNIYDDYTSLNDGIQTNNSSTISLKDLKELNGNINLPKKSGRKKSDKNISSINLDV